jgi:prepilin-type N-terminal cleavage/methylation domain
VNFIKVSIKDDKFIKKGFTLIELLLAVSIAGIIISSQVLIICKYLRIHRQEIIHSRESFYVNEAFMIIEHEVNSAKYASVENNAIKLKSYSRSGYDYIRIDRDQDIIISYDYSHSNNILKNIKDFKVQQDNQLLYIYVETKEGNIYRRCLGLERVKIKDTL